MDYKKLLDNWYLAKMYCYIVIALIGLWRDNYKCVIFFCILAFVMAVLHLDKKIK